MANNKIIVFGTLLACSLAASFLLNLNIFSRAVSDSLAESKKDGVIIYGIYISDFGEQLTLREDGSYTYHKVLVTGEDYKFSGQFYFSEEENFESGKLNKVIKFKDYASTFDAWKNDKSVPKGSTFHVFFGTTGSVKFCNYGGLHGDYNCFRPVKELR
ncbi:hypothetical protein [Rheinheimera sp. 4Y26]|uniref:hypothetical protein n=1 Tax=Rheinheimera sp. 4Y26 TaxID=2977811 RepID=UPI0021B0A8EB|nr:hypothetical protein [Rheinheimera sp. 4Y26]MCT6699312.1 hypothetical protein [Rheinheimera sp. 4Y26]